MIPDAGTALYGIIGRPLSHTLSPAMHNAAFQALNINAVYLAFDTGDLQGAMAAMRILGIRGISVTIPHKEAAMAFLDAVDPAARTIGAVNTVVNRGAGLTGYNTDGFGALEALRRVRDPAGCDCLIIGAGGAARAVAVALKDIGARPVITNRSHARGRSLAEVLSCSFVPFSKFALEDAPIVIQTTPVGMFPHVDEMPLPPERLAPGSLVMDIIYNPRETRFLQEARARGCRTISGLDMLIFQGARQFELWTGRPAPLHRMRDAVQTAMNRSRPG